MIEAVVRKTKLLKREVALLELDLSVDEGASQSVDKSKRFKFNQNQSKAAENEIFNYPQVFQSHYSLTLSGIGLEVR